MAYAVLLSQADLVVDISDTEGVLVPQDGCRWLLATKDPSGIEWANGAAPGLGMQWDGNNPATFSRFTEIVPISVSMRQARLALLGAGLLDRIEATLAALPSPQREAAQIDWEYATEVRRKSPLVAGLTPALGLTDGQIDALFIAAASIP